MYHEDKISNYNDFFADDVEPPFSLDDPGELCMKKVVDIIPSTPRETSGKPNPSDTSPAEVTTRSGRKVTPPRKKDLISEIQKPSLAPHPQPSLTFTVGAKSRGVPGTNKASKKLGGSQTPAIPPVTDSSSKSIVSSSASTSTMKSKSSSRSLLTQQSLGADAPNNGDNVAADQQVSHVSFF